MGTIAVDGVALDDPAGRWLLTSETRLRPVPAAQAVTVQIPGRHGALPIPSPTWDVGGITLGLLVTDRRPDGSEPAAPQDRAAQTQGNLDMLRALLGVRYRLLELSWTHPDGTVLIAPGRVLTSIPTDLETLTALTLTVGVEIPGVVWQDVDAVTQASAVAGASAITQAWTALAGGTAPIEDAVLLAAGPMSRLVVTDVESGSWVRWDGALTDQQAVRIDAGAMTATRVAPGDWDGAGTDVSGGLTVGPGGFQLVPGSVTREVATTLTRLGGDGAVSIRARRSWL
jgi:hypothetical protein